MTDYGIPIEYTPRNSEHKKIYQIILKHKNTFFANRSLEGIDYAPYIINEFDEFLKCGIYAHGVSRLHCEHCNFDEVIPFSCKRRGFCSSCGARRMAETALHIVDSVMPEVPVRQFVITFPYLLRMWLASQKKHVQHIGNIICQRIKAFIITKTPRASVTDKLETGLICFLQRFGSALNLNPHFHILAMDGAYETKETDRAKFYHAHTPTQEELAHLLREISREINDYLIKLGLIEIQDDQIIQMDTTDILEPELDPQLHLPAMQASILCKIAFGPDAGKPVRRLRTAHGVEWREENTFDVLGDKCVAHAGYTLHAATAIRAEQRKRLENLISYMSRGAISEERIEIVGEQIQVKLKTAWRDGTEFLLFTAEEFIEKLIALIPPPWANLTRYFGAFAARSKIRKYIVPEKKAEETQTELPKKPKAYKKGKGWTAKIRYCWNNTPSWANLLKRVFGIDAKVCPKCGGERTIIEVLYPGEGLTELLRILKIPEVPPAPAPAQTRQHLFEYEDWC